MLLRMRVKGFKNLRDAEIRFGPLTCFVGPNGVGKSNIFDAIQFLRELADNDIQSAAQAVRSPSTGSFGPRDLFIDGDTRQPISFEVDMLVPHKVTDDFGREAEPATTLLRYEVAFQYVDDGRLGALWFGTPMISLSALSTNPTLENPWSKQKGEK